MMKKQNKDIDITPPQSVSAIRKLADDQALVIGITEGGAVYLEGELAGINELHEALRRCSENEPDRQIRIDTDEATPFHRVVQVMDICQFRGLKDVVIRTYDERYNRK
jgi:biopolymer transport protein ExbD